MYTTKFYDWFSRALTERMMQSDLSTASQREEPATANTYKLSCVDCSCQLPRGRWRGACQWTRPLTQAGEPVYPATSASAPLT